MPTRHHKEDFRTSCLQIRIFFTPSAVGVTSNKEMIWLGLTQDLSVSKISCKLYHWISKFLHSTTLITWGILYFDRLADSVASNVIKITKKPIRQFVTFMTVYILSFVTLRKVLKRMKPIQMYTIHLYYINPWIIKKWNSDVSNMEFHLRTYNDIIHIKILCCDVTCNPFWMDDGFKWQDMSYLALVNTK